MNSLISRINLSNSFFFFRVFELADLSERSFIFYKKKARACLSRCGTHLFDLYLTGRITKDRLNVNDGPNGRHDERSFYITQSSPFTMSSSTSHTHTWVEKILNKTVDPSLPLASFDFNFVNQMRILFFVVFLAVLNHDPSFI
jgi:hypothetical protein